MLSIDIAPLIDVMFILLIFFLVSTSFLRDAAIPVERPVASQAAEVERAVLRVAVTARGTVYVEGRSLSLPALSEHVHQRLEAEPDGTVLVIPDRDLPSGGLVAVLDAVRLGGGRDVAVATRPPSGDGQ